MAWIDDRIWCHPKIADISDKAFRTYINALAYSSGFHCHGQLSDGQQQIVGATRRVHDELVEAGLWEPNGNGIYIHDWAEHNEKRDARRAADRERKRLARLSGQGADK